MCSTHLTPWICCVKYGLSLENVIQPPPEHLLTYFTICEWNSTVSSLRSSAPCASPASAWGCMSTARNFHKCFKQRSTTLHLFEQVCPVHWHNGNSEKGLFWCNIFLKACSCSCSSINKYGAQIKLSHHSGRLTISSTYVSSSVANYVYKILTSDDFALFSVFIVWQAVVLCR